MHEAIRWLVRLPHSKMYHFFDLSLDKREVIITLIIDAFAACQSACHLRAVNAGNKLEKAVENGFLNEKIR